MSPRPSTLAQAQALFVIAREYGFRSWPVLKRHVQRQTRTVFSDAEGATQVFAGMLDGNVTIAESFEEALESRCEVLVLDLQRRRDKPFPEATRDDLRARKLVLTGPWADELCRELDLEIGGNNAIEGQPLRVVDGTLLAGVGSVFGENAIEPFAEYLPHEVYGRREQDLRFRHIPEELRLSGDSGFVEVLLAPADRGDEAAIVAREANCVFAGVNAHPRRWSDAYRRVFARVVAALADREPDAYRPAIVPKPVQEPGTVRFELDAPLGSGQTESRSGTSTFDSIARRCSPPRSSIVDPTRRRSSFSAVESSFIGPAKTADRGRR